MQRQMAAAGIAGNIAQFASPALTSFYQQPMYAGNFAGNTVQSALMGQQQAGPQLFNPESTNGVWPCRRRIQREGARGDWTSSGKCCKVRCHYWEQSDRLEVRQLKQEWHKQIF